VNRTVSIDRVITAFEMMPSWQDRYRLIIDMGRKLPELPEEHYADENLLDGCMSNVWMTAGRDDSTDPPVMHFQADSDSQIVKGLIAIVFEVFNNRPPEEVVTTDIESVFQQLDLEQHISSGRRNGLSSMVRRVRELAQAELAA
jgi:cysteine desulfuration protein SufE